MLIIDHKVINIYTAREILKAFKETEQTSKKHREKNLSILSEKPKRTVGA